MKLDRALNLHDLRRSAQQRLPRIIFDFIEGGCDDDAALERNRAAFADWRLVPRYLVDASARSQAVTVLGQRFDAPFGVCPMGLAGLAHPGADLLLAEVAAEFNLPYLMSNASNASIEQAARIAPRNTWFQIYLTTDHHINHDLVKRARDLELGTLVVTVDVPENSNRERNRRNGFGRPPKMTLPVMLEAALHPGWVLQFLRSGRTPGMENWDPYAPRGAGKLGGADLYGRYTPARAMTWAQLAEVRALWPGKLVVKGILAPADAVLAADCGVDGIVVSNHGGRQLDSAPAALDVLPWIRAAVGDRVELLLDSGVRRGSDVIKALALGARCTLFGRPWLYGAVAGRGRAGVRHVATLLRREIDIIMGQVGLTDLDQIPPGTVWRPAGAGAPPPGMPDKVVPMS